MHFQRVASANRVEELRHQERWQQVQEETNAALQELRRLCKEREQRAQEKYKQMLQEKNRQLKGQRFVVIIVNRIQIYSTELFSFVLQVVENSTILINNLFFLM